MCDCNTTDLPSPSHPDIAAAIVEQNPRTARALICNACPHKRVVTELEVLCGVNGQRILPILWGQELCPKGKHPRPDGTVRYIGLSWQGVPMPIRQYAMSQARRKGRQYLAGSVAGCGCLTLGLRAMHAVAGAMGVLTRRRAVADATKARWHRGMAGLSRLSVWPLGGWLWVSRSRYPARRASLATH